MNESVHRLVPLNPSQYSNMESHHRGHLSLLTPYIYLLIFAEDAAKRSVLPVCYWLLHRQRRYPIAASEGPV
jgi:hypothetical protein